MLWLLVLLAPRLVALDFHPLHHFGAPRPFEAFFLRLIECRRVQEMAALSRGLLLFDRNTMLVGEGVLAHAGHLPGDFDVRLVCPDREAVALDFAGHDRLRELADDRELVAEVPVERFEIIGQGHGGFAIAAGRYGAVVDVHLSVSRILADSLLSLLRIT